MRVRDTSRWGIGSLYPERDFFLDSPIEPGLHTIQQGNTLIDFLVRDRGADTTLIFFHAVVKSSTSYPVLSGEGLASSAGSNLIAISDPALAVTGEV